MDRFHVVEDPISYAETAFGQNPQMLTLLAIKDFAVVTSTELEFGSGLTVISGETGAGKSLLVDALAFLSGLRADSGAVRHGAERAELTAHFDLNDRPEALDWLRAHDLDESADCQLRRTLRADGGSKAWINGRPVTLAQLSELAALLVEIHGQHEHQALLAKSSQLALFDDYGRHDARLATADAATRWNALSREQAALSQRGDVSDQVAYLTHQLEELERESLTPEQIVELNTAHRRHAHSAALIAACESVFTQLTGEEAGSITRRVQQVRAELMRVTEYEPRLKDVDALLDAASIQMDEAVLSIERIREDLDLDPNQFDEMENRIARLHDLARKHRVSVNQLAERRDGLATELEALRHAGERALLLAQEIVDAAMLWQSAAALLTRQRAQTARTLSQSITQLLDELGMGGGRFEVAIEPSTNGKPDVQGAERIEFLVSANAGQPPKPLRRIASGGELSRISLAIEVATLGSDAVPTMVFDEVDSGIGGAVADIVGRKLRSLSQKRQVLCVTHLPQVAAQGHTHYSVSKSAATGITQSEVKKLQPKQRLEELARMLGGVKIGSEARAAAQRLLEDAETGEP